MTKHPATAPQPGPGPVTPSTSASAIPRPATGHTWELRRGTARARIGEVAAVLRGFSVDGVPYTETWPDTDTPPMGCGMVLMPWPNRVAGGEWRHAGAPQLLDITERDRGNAIHGLLRNTAYRATEVGDDTVTLAAPIYPQHGWPFTLDTAVRYALTDDGLDVTHRVTNVGAQPAVFGCGAHPYLRVGATNNGECELTIRAGRVLVTDDAMIPVDETALPADLAGLRSGARVADLDLDTGFAGLEPAGGDGRFEHRLRAPNGSGVTLWADPAFAWVQVFTPHDFPGDDGPRQAVAIEPMTCPADALNSGQGLIGLQPGESWSGSWGITPIPAS